MDMTKVFTAKETSKELLAISGVVGMGVGYKTEKLGETDTLSVIVYVEKKKPVAALLDGDLIPQRIQSVLTDVVEVGVLRALQARTDKWRPAPGGVSIGHYKITAGTLGTIVTEKGTGIKLILSNNHVLANSNDASVGDPIYQPGPTDGGKSSDTIASLYNFVPLDFGEGGDSECSFAEMYTRIGNWLSDVLGSQHKLTVTKINPQAVNYMDAALAIPNEQNLIEDIILEVDEITAVEEAVLGMNVGKSGRTTGKTIGHITGVHATVKVQYGDGKVATLDEQIISTAMGAGGDSGSLMYSLDGLKAVGLLFAGSSQVTIYSPIQRVLDALHVMI